MKKFPYDMVLLNRPNGVEVVAANGIYHDYLTFVVSDLHENEIQQQVLTKGSDRVFFDIDTPDAAYLLKGKIGSFPQKFFYKPFQTEFLFSEPKRLQIQGVGSGRCGTQSLARYLDGLFFENGQRVTSRHETLATSFLTGILEEKKEELIDLTYSYHHNVEVAPYFWFVPETITGEKVLLLVRDGRKVVNSGMARGWFKRESLWDMVKPEYDGSVFEKCCTLWAKSCEVLLPLADVVTRLEDLSSSAESRKLLLQSLGISVPENDNFPLSNQSTAHVKNELTWSPQQKTKFEEICSEHMDYFYPDWKKSF